MPEKITVPEKRKTNRKLTAGLFASVVAIAALNYTTYVESKSPPEEGQLHVPEECLIVPTNTDNLEFTLESNIEEALKDPIKEGIQNYPQTFLSPNTFTKDFVEYYLANEIEAENLYQLENGYQAQLEDSDSYEESFGIASEVAGHHNITLIPTATTLENESYRYTPYTKNEYEPYTDIENLVTSPLYGLNNELHELPTNLMQDLDIELSLQIVEGLESRYTGDTAAGQALLGRYAIVISADYLQVETGVLQHEIGHWLDFASGCLYEDTQYEELEKDITEEMREQPEELVGTYSFTEYGADKGHIEDKADGLEEILQGLPLDDGGHDSEVLRQKEAVLWNRLFEISPVTAQILYFRAYYDSDKTQEIANENEEWQAFQQKHPEIYGN